MFNIYQTQQSNPQLSPELQKTLEVMGYVMYGGLMVIFGFFISDYIQMKKR